MIHLWLHCFTHARRKNEDWIPLSPKSNHCRLIVLSPTGGPISWFIHCSTTLVLMEWDWLGLLNRQNFFWRHDTQAPGDSLSLPSNHPNYPHTIYTWIIAIHMLFQIQLSFFLFFMSYISYYCVWEASFLLLLVLALCSFSRLDIISQTSSAKVWPTNTT